MEQNEESDGTAEMWKRKQMLGAEVVEAEAIKIEWVDAEAEMEAVKRIWKRKRKW